MPNTNMSLRMRGLRGLAKVACFTIGTVNFCWLLGLTIANGLVRRNEWTAFRSQWAWSHEYAHLRWLVGIGAVVGLIYSLIVLCILRRRESMSAFLIHGFGKFYCIFAAAVFIYYAKHTWAHFGFDIQRLPDWWRTMFMRLTFVECAVLVGLISSPIIMFATECRGNIRSILVVVGVVFVLCVFSGPVESLSYAAHDFHGRRAVRICSMTAFLLVGSFVAIAFLPDIRKSRTGVCNDCDYDLQGSVSGVCSECGARVESENENANERGGMIERLRGSRLRQVACTLIPVVLVVWIFLFGLIGDKWGYRW